MDRDGALQARMHALQAVEQLSLVLKAIVGRASEDEFEAIKKSVGLAIGRIQSGILDPLHRQYPDIDDLK